MGDPGTAGADSLTTFYNRQKGDHATPKLGSHETVGLDGETAEERLLASSDRIRQAWECPVCLELASVMLCRCPNGHAQCDSCTAKLRDGDEFVCCPICRSPMADTQDARDRTAKMAEDMARAKVACAHRRYGCAQIVAVIRAPDHEAECSFKPDAHCLVSLCQWMGVYDQLFNHVNSAHTKFAVVSEV